MDICDENRTSEIRKRNREEEMEMIFNADEMLTKVALETQNFNSTLVHRLEEMQKEIANLTQIQCMLVEKLLSK